MDITDRQADAMSAVEENAAAPVDETEDYCCCPEPGCEFEGAPTTLFEHLTDAHGRPIYDVMYGQPWYFTLPLSRPWDVAFGIGEDDRSAFFVLIQEAEPGASKSVSLQVCVDRDEAPQPMYRCKMALETSPSSRHRNRVLPPVTTQAAVCDKMRLEVPQEMVLRGGTTLAVTIRVDQVLPAS